MNHLVSVFVPIYNISQRYPGILEKFIKSLQNQTYRNLEIILVDDGSTDDSGAICDQYAKFDQRIHVYHTDNQGIVKARETGFQKSTADYIYYADPDDLIHPQVIEIMLNLLSKHDDCQLCFADHFALWNEVSFPEIDNPKYEFQDKDFLIKNVLCKGSCAMWNILFRREMLEQTEFRQAEHNDFDYMLRLCLNHVTKFIYLKETTYCWMQREYSATHRLKEARLIRLTGTWTEEWRLFIKDKYPEYYGSFLYYTYRESMDNLLSSTTDKSLQSTLRKILAEYKAETWSYFKQSTDISTKKKIAMWWLLRYPHSKGFLRKVNRLLHIIK